MFRLVTNTHQYSSIISDKSWSVPGISWSSLLGNSAGCLIWFQTFVLHSGRKCFRRFADAPFRRWL
jgi:hypothetical protein